MASGPEKQGPGERGRSRKLQEGTIYAYKLRIGMRLQAGNKDLPVP